MLGDNRHSKTALTLTVYDVIFVQMPHAMIEADFIFEYFDLLGNKYKQIASMRFEASEDSLELKACSTSDNELVQFAGD